MENFEEQIVNQIQKRILENIKELNILDRWPNNKLKIPESIIQKAWDKINWSEVINIVTENLQDKICQTIVQNMMTETKTDVKKLLSIDGMRQKIRMEAYPKIKEVLGL